MTDLTHTQVGPAVFAADAAMAAARPRPAKSARWRFRLLRAGRFKLDGGSMFGLIPRSIWSKTVATDDRGRIEVQHNCLLLERADDGPGGGLSAVGPRRVLIECGTGDKLDAKMRAVFDLEPRTVVDALREAGVGPAEIDAVVVTHLHFDHAGALTRLARPGERADYTGEDGGGGSSAAGGCVLTFPNATVHVQAREWGDALANRSVMTRTYYRDHLLPVRERVRMVDSPRPFPPGVTVDRDELPASPVDLRLSELWPGAGIHVFAVPGHTWGQQGVLFQEPDGPEREGRGEWGGVVGRTVVFTPDVMPTVHHVGAAYSLAYDVEPYTSMLSRRWLLTEAAERGWLLCLDHEPGNPYVRVRADGKGWFELEPASA